MKCVQCNAEITLRAQFCPRCGQKVNYDFNTLAQSVHDDAEVRRGKHIQLALGSLFLALTIACTVLYGVNEVYSRPLNFDGAGVPALPANVAVTAESTVALPAYREPRPQPPLPQPLLTAFGYRREPMRSQLLQANKGAVTAGKSIETTIKEGLKFLAGAQEQDGSWSVKAPLGWTDDETAQFEWGRVGVTGLALLAFFGEGESWRPNEDGSATPYAEKLRQGVRFLLAQQDPAGRFGPATGETVHHMYNHGMATWAMVEAAGLTGDPFLKTAAQKGVDFIVQTQAAKGGWNYWGRVEGDSDTFVTAWQVQALLAARECGLTVPDAVLKNAGKMFSDASHGDGYVNYTLEEKTNDKDPRAARCAVALFLRQILGEQPRSVRALAEKVLRFAPAVNKDWGPNWQPHGASSPDDLERAKYDPHFIYFATGGMFLNGGHEWDTWNEAMKAAVPQMQDRDGSWRTNDQYSKQGGVIYSTALSILTLQCYYRQQ